MKKNLLAISSTLLFCFAQAQTPTWATDIAPILYANCTKCHHTGGAGHFPLLTFSDAYANAFNMSNDVSNGIMPPWPPDENYKHFAHERVISQTEIDAINNWVSGGRPIGDITQAPAQPTYSNGSQLGTVDLSVKIPTYTVGANNDVYRNFPIPTGLIQGKYVTAFEVIPGNPMIVHHVLIFQDSTNAPATSDASDPGPGYTNAGGTGSLASKLIGGFTPGTSPYYTPVGTGFRLPTGTNIVVQIHYPAGSQGLVDSTRINFKLSSTPLREITVYPLVNHLQNMTNGPINIAANTTKTYYEQYSVGSANYTFLSAFPHMHLIGRTIESFATTTLPNDTIRFVNVPDWDFHWQDTYVFPNAVKVPSNSTIKAKAFYDNTANNPDNPNSPLAAVHAGEATTDEMMMVFFGFMPYQSGDENLIIDRRVIPQGATTFCTGQHVVLKTIEGTGYTYQWYKNGVSINGANAFSYTATQAGNYHVIISLGPNNSNSDTIAVTVSVSPTATISAASNSFCPNSSVQLNASTGSGYTYQWLNSGAPISGATSSTYSANTAGTYTVQIYNGCYALSSATNISAASAPSNTLTTSGATTFCTGGSVSLNATSGLTYHWSNNATSQSVSINQSGNYTVTVTNANNCTAVSSPVSVTVNALPSSTVTPNGSTTFCNGSNVVLTAVAGLSYNWSNGSNTASVTVTQTGNYSVTVTDANTCSASSSAIHVTVNPLPSVSISASGATEFCDGGSVTLTANNAVSYLWSNASTAATITANTSGNYSVTITDGNGCSNSTLQTVTEYPVPDNSITTDRPTTICPGESVTLTAAAGMSYSWSNSSTAQSIVVSVNGVFSVTVTDTHNCIAISSPVTIVVSNNAEASITPSGATNLCEGGSVQLTASSGDIYLWSNGETSQTINVNATGNFSVTVTTSGTCIALSDTTHVIVNSNPVVSLSGNMDTVCSSAGAVYLIGGTPFGGTYSGNSVTGDLFDASAAPVGSNIITYSYTDNNGCSGTSTETIEVEVCTGISDLATNTIRVYPNPNNGNFEIDLSGTSSAIVQLKVFDATGKMIANHFFSGNKTSLQLNEIAAGIYLLELKTASETRRTKLIIQR